MWIVYNLGMKQVSREDDRRMAQGLLCGDKKALREFYRNCHPRLLAFVSGRVKRVEDAEEIVQDSFLGLLDSLPLFSFRSSLWTFLVSIAKHEVADYYRRLYAKRAIKYVPFVDQIYTEPVYSANETVELFYKALKKVSIAERDLLLWKYEDKLSVKEIAARLGVGVKAAESKLFRARKSFRSAYAEVEG